MSPARGPAADQRVLEGARRALDRYGWQATTAERIAEEAGLSRVTLHRRGLTKDVILGQLAEQAEARYREAMWAPLTTSGPAYERLEQALDLICRLAEENLSLLVALDAQANATVFHDEAEEALTRNVFTEPLERILRDGISDDSLRAVDPSEAATVLFNLVGWTYLHLRTSHRWRLERARELTVEIALRGVAAVR